MVNNNFIGYVEYCPDLYDWCMFTHHELEFLMYGMTKRECLQNLKRQLESGQLELNKLIEFGKKQKSNNN